MTLEEHILKAEEDAKMAEFDTEWGMGNYFIDRTEALEYAKECRNLVKWLKELSEYKNMLECGYRLVCLDKIRAEISEAMDMEPAWKGQDNYIGGLQIACSIIDKYRQEG